MRQGQRSQSSDTENRYPYALVGLGLVVAAIMVVTGELLDSSWRLGFEIAKVGLEFAVVVVLGGFWTAVMNVRDRKRSAAEREREARRRQDDYLREVWLRDCIDAYNRIKGVRRGLRALGFANQESPPSFESRDVSEFHALMGVLDEAQLTLERIAEDVTERADLVHDQPRALANLRCAEHYVADVLKVWERDGAKVRVGSDASLLSELQWFVTPAGLENFKRDLATPLKEFRGALRDELLRGWPAGPRD